MKVEILNASRVRKLKRSYISQHVDFDALATVLHGDDLKPNVGDFVIARVETIGQHQNLELTTGRKSMLFPGDEILVCYGNRYAPDQFEAIIPEDLSTCDLVAAGGMASKMLSRHINMDEPTTLSIVGLLGDSTCQRINLANWAIPTQQCNQLRPFTIAVVGTSMNSGKTTTAFHLIKALSNAGFDVGAAKITGTGAGGDIWKMRDAGAKVAVDFTFAGYPSTYKLSEREVEGILKTLGNHLTLGGVDVRVFEVADGLYQEETSALVSSPEFRAAIDGVLFASNSAMGAVAGVQWLESRGLPILGISGLVTASPLATRETAQATGLPLFDLETIHTSAASLLAPIQRTESTFSLIGNESRAGVRAFQG